MSHASPLFPGYIPATRGGPAQMAMIQSTKPSLKFAARKLAYPLGYVGPPITSNPTKFREAAAAQYMLMLS